MSLADLPVPLDLEPMEAKSVDTLPTGPGWRFEPKWDGFRCLAFRSGDQVELRAKSGKPLHRYFPEVAARLLASTPDPFVIDGELVIPVEGALSFDALQARLHPAESRIRKLSLETPAFLVAFDCLLAQGGPSLLDRPLAERRPALERLVTAIGPDAGVRLTPSTPDLGQAERWLAGVGAATDGVVAKREDGPYVTGERAMLKIKRLRTADCVVGGFRYEAPKTGTAAKRVGSLLLGLYDGEGLLNHVGFTSAIAAADRTELTARLEAVREPPGFTGRAPGGPSRWSTERSGDWEPLRPELVVEVRFDHVTGDRFRHGTALLRWRPDKAPRQCTMEQLASTSLAPALAFQSTSSFPPT